MGFYEENLRYIEQIRQNRELTRELYDLHANMPTENLIGQSMGAFNSFRRGFYTARRNIEGIPLGIKTGENEAVEFELGIFEYFHNHFPQWTNKGLLPKVFGFLATDRDNSFYRTLVMEDFSQGGKYAVKEMGIIYPELETLCEKESEGTQRELRRTNFEVQKEGETIYPIGDLNTIYGYLKREVRREIGLIIRDHYLDEKLLERLTI